MGNPLNSVLKYIDPIGNAAGNAISGPHGVLTPKQAPAPPGYNPANNPGSHLFTPPPGGAPGGGGAPGTLFGGGQPSSAGYDPNPFIAATQGGRNPGAGGPSPTMPIYLGRGGSNSRPMAPGMAPPAVSSGVQGMPQDPQLQQQMAIVAALRGNPYGQPMAGNHA